MGQTIRNLGAHIAIPPGLFQEKISRLVHRASYIEDHRDFLSTSPHRHGYIYRAMIAFESLTIFSSFVFLTGFRPQITTNMDGSRRLSIAVHHLYHMLKSVEKHPREIDIILYYPISDYIDYLEIMTPFELHREIQVPHLYKINNDERFLIYRYKG